IVGFFWRTASVMANQARLSRPICFGAALRRPLSNFTGAFHDELHVSNRRRSPQQPDFRIRAAYVSAFRHGTPTDPSVEQQRTTVDETDARNVSCWFALRQRLAHRTRWLARGRLFRMSDITRVLDAIDADDPQAAAQLLPLVYDELRRLAAQKMAQEKAG